MSKEKSIVVTAYGHDRTVDKFSVSLLNESRYSDDTEAKNYCNTINSLELKDDNWVFARKISANTQYTLESFIPFKFSQLILRLEDRSLQKVMREIDCQIKIAKALAYESDDVKSKAFKNMSKRAVQMLKDDMECIGQTELSESKQAQDEIISIIRHLVDCGEIISPYKD